MSLPRSSTEETEGLHRMTGQGRIVKTVVRDCLYLNWAFPPDELPVPPEPLRYEIHSAGGRQLVFTTALLFRHESLHLKRFSPLKLSYPQFHLRLHVLDHDDVPAVWLRQILVPGWVLPGVRWLGQQPAEPARFKFPRPSEEPDLDEWSWEISQRCTLSVAAKQSSPTIGAGPNLGSWQEVVDCLRLRERAYVATGSGVRAIHTAQRSVALWPVKVRLNDLGLLERSKALREISQWPDLHSSWICPEIPFTFEVARETVTSKLRQTTVPVAPDPAMFRSSSTTARRPAA